MSPKTLGHQVANRRVYFILLGNLPKPTWLDEFVQAFNAFFAGLRSREHGCLPLVIINAYDSPMDSGVHFEKFFLEIGAHHVYPGFLSWS